LIQKILNFTRSVGKAFSVITDSLFGDVECKECKILHAWLETEISKREYYERLILIKAGILLPATQEDNLENFESIHRYATLSAIRRAAEIHQIQLKKQTEKADDKDKTPGEKLFEQELVSGKEA
jgi:hypothetical protein